MSTDDAFSNEKKIRSLHNELARKQEEIAALKTALEAQQDEFYRVHETLRVYTEALKDTEEKLWYTFHQAPIGVAMVSLDLRIVRVNSKFCEMTGYGEEELRSMQLLDITHKDDLADDLVCVRRLMEGEISGYQKEKRYVRKDGSILYARTSVSMVRDSKGRALYFLPMIQDITRQKRSEKALRESELKYRILAETAEDFIYIVGKDMRVTYVNQSGAVSLGKTPEEVMGLPLERFFPPETYGYMRECLIKAFETGASLSGTHKYTFYNMDHFLDVKLTPIVDKDHAVTGVLGISRDITNLIKIEDDLKDAKRQAELYVDVMAHDIRNMNQVGIGFLELALDSMELDENGRYLLSKPLWALKNSSTIIDNVRKLQRARSGELGHKEMDLGQVLKDVRSNYSGMHGREIVINYAPVTGYRVMANELLYDLFSNLVGNAIKHSTGDLTIDIVVERTSENGRDYYRVAIEDDGPGISDGMKGALFRRRIDASGLSNGIGLFLVRALVEGFHGTVTAEDRVPGDHAKGSKFVVLLPVFASLNDV